MPEELNQVTNDDFDFEYSTDMEENAPTSDLNDVEEDSTQENTIEPFLTIRYDKAEKGLSKDDAITYAQKGMNYDRLNEKYNKLNDSITRLAKENSMSVDDYISKLSDVQNQFRKDKEIKSLKEQYPDVDDSILEAWASDRISKNENLEIREKQTEKDIQLNRQIEAFSRRFPNVNINELDDKVIDLMNDGYTMLEAYTLNENDKMLNDKTSLSKQLEDIRKSEEKRKKSLGNLENTGSVESDDFLNELFSN